MADIPSIDSMRRDLKSIKKTPPPAEPGTFRGDCRYCAEEHERFKSTLAFQIMCDEEYPEGQRTPEQAEREVSIRPEWRWEGAKLVVEEPRKRCRWCNGYVGFTVEMIDAIMTEDDE